MLVGSKSLPVRKKSSENSSYKFELHLKRLAVIYERSALKNKILSFFGKFNAFFVGEP